MALGNVRQLPKGTFNARYMYRGVSYSKTFQTKGQAMGWLEREERLIHYGDWTPPKERAREAEAKEVRESFTVEAAIREWLARDGIKESTRQANQRDLAGRLLNSTHPAIRSFAATPVTDVTKADARAWWAAVKLYRPETKTANHRVYKAVRAAFKRLVEEDRLPANPIHVPDAAKRPKAKEKYLPPRAELVSVVAAMPEDYKALTVLVFFGGLRIGEALGVTVEDVTFTKDGDANVRVCRNLQRLEETDQAGKKHVRMVSQRPKTDNGYRVVPILAPEYAAILKTQWEKVNELGPCDVLDGERFAAGETVPLRLLTRTAKGNAVMDTSYRSILARAMKRAGANEKLHPHCGRYWLATELAKRGAVPAEIGRILGQKDLKTITEIYTQVQAGRPEQLMRLVAEGDQL